MTPVTVSVSDDDFKKAIGNARELAPDGEICIDIGVSRPTLDGWSKQPPRQQVKDHYYEELQRFIKDRTEKGVRD